jgi:hypothetical protein
VDKKTAELLKKHQAKLASKIRYEMDNEGESRDERIKLDRYKLKTAVRKYAKTKLDLDIDTAANAEKIELIKERRRQYYQANKERIKATSREAYRKKKKRPKSAFIIFLADCFNGVKAFLLQDKKAREIEQKKERMREYRRAYYLANKDAFKGSSKRYYEKNKVEIRLKAKLKARKARGGRNG